jgi:uncharacterized protein with FMN-binding domain
MRRVILAICATAAALVLLLSFKTHTQSAATGASPASAIGTPTPGNSAAPAPASGAGRAVTGEAISTIYGPVQVRITVSDRKITGVTAVVYPENTAMDSQINAVAVPKLNSEALAANSASIDAVSGATYTSQGYIGSLQSAVDQAGLQSEP